jgi:hypothetical protein
MGPPDKVRIPRDGRRFEYLGTLVDGRQFLAFVTGAFPDGVQPSWENDEWQKVKSWSAVLHLFDADGNHLSSEVRLGGYDTDSEAGAKAWFELRGMLARLAPGEPEFGDIWIRQFATTIDSVTHSLLYEASDEVGDGRIVEGVFLEPRGIMFHPPWDSGMYST